MRELFEQKYKENEKALFLVAVFYLHNTEDAKDCMQDAALAAFKSFDRLKNKAYFKTWFTRIVINKCKDHIKKQKHTEYLTDDLNVFYNMPVSDMEIVDAVCRLKKGSALYIALRFYNDITYAEAARALKQPVSTVKYRTGRALAELKNILEGDADK